MLLRRRRNFSWFRNHGPPLTNHRSIKSVRIFLMTLLSSLVIFYTSANINSHDLGRGSYCCAAGAKFYFRDQETVEIVWNILMTLLFMITFMTFWVGPKDMLAPLQSSEVLGGAMAGLAFPWIRQWGSQLLMPQRNALTSHFGCVCGQCCKPRCIYDSLAVFRACVTRYVLTL